MLQMNTEKVCFVIVKAREYDVKEATVLEEDAGNLSDERYQRILADDEDDPTAEELARFIDGLNEDEQCELVALTWLGRGDFSADEWEDAMESARSRRNGSTSRYLLGIPVLGDYLEEGLAQFDLSCDDVELSHL